MVSYTAQLVDLSETAKKWDYRPLLSMYPHWSKLKHLSLLIDAFERTQKDSLAMDLGTITTLQSLETLSMAFNYKEIRDDNHPILSLLEFPNITKISINVFMFDSVGDEKHSLCSR